MLTQQTTLQSTSSSRSVTRTVSILLGVVAVILALFFYRFGVAHKVSDEVMQQWGAFIYPQAQAIPPFSLQDSSGKAFTPASLQGHWSLVFMGFTRCPDICPTTMASLKQFESLMATSKLRQDTQVIMVTLDPAYDTPERIGNYVHEFDPGFIGVTGSKDGIKAFAAALHVAFEQDPEHKGQSSALAHSGQVALFNPQGQMAGFFRSPLDALNVWRAYQALRS